MAWCPNCDEMREVAASAACPVCSALTLDAGPLRSPTPASGKVAVLELEPEAPPAEPGMPPSFSIRSAFSRRKLIAGLVVAALAGAGAGLTQLSGAPKAKPRASSPASEPSAVPSAETAPVEAEPAPLPPLGSPVAGTLTLIAEDAITRIDLRTGQTSNTTLAESSGWFRAFSPDGKAFAYRDDPGMLWVVPAPTQSPVALVSDVTDYVFTEDGRSVIVLRSEYVNNDTARYRIERRAVDFSRTDLLYETTRQVSGLWWRRGTLIIRMNDGRNDGIYEVTGRTKARLVRNKATIFDVSADGERILAGPEFPGPGLWVVDVSAKTTKPAGPSNLLVGRAVFAPNGTSIAITGTTDWEQVEICGDGGECGNEYTPNSSVLYRAEAGSSALKKLFAGTELTGVVWGPGNWIFFINGSIVTATTGAGGERTITGWTGTSPSALGYSA